MNSKNILKLVPIFLISFFLAGCSSTKQLPISTTMKYSPQELKEDFNFLIQTDEQVHPNLFVHTSKVVFDSMITVIQAKLNKPMTSFDFYMLIEPAISKLRDGHTFLMFPYVFRQKYLDNGGRIIPFDIYLKDGKMFVSKNYSSDSTLSANSEIISINSVKAPNILERLRNYTAGEFSSIQNYKIENSFKPLLWACYGFNGPFNVKYISSLGKKSYKKTFAGITGSKFDSLLLRSKKIKHKYQKWTFKFIDKNEIALIDMNSFGLEKDLDIFNKFLDSSFTEIKQKKVHNLIIDVRNNGGGESQLTEALVNFVAKKPWVLFSRADWKRSSQSKSDMIPWYVRWIPIKTLFSLFGSMFTSQQIGKVEYDSLQENLLHAYMKPALKNNPLRFKGNIYVLINSGSFSASVLFAAVMKDYDFGTLIGEETGQSANPFGGNYFFNLPHTNLQASVSTGRSYRPSGRETGHGVIPDYFVKQSINSSENGKDTVMEFTKKLIEKNINDRVAR